MLHACSIEDDGDGIAYLFCQDVHCTVVELLYVLVIDGSKSEVGVF